MRDIDQIRRALKLHRPDCQCLQHVLLREYDDVAIDMAKLRDCVVDLVALYAGSLTARAYPPEVIRAEMHIEKARKLIAETADRALLTQAEARQTEVA